MFKLTLINENIDLGQIWVFSVRFSVYIDCPSVLSLNSHKLHKQKQEKKHAFCEKKKITLWLTLNLRLVLTGV